jgi:co-chaperonin GroES (HSP10)
MATPVGYQKPTNLNDNDYITDPNLPDPENLPEMLGWNILCRPYPVDQMTRGGIILSVNDTEVQRNATNIARVVDVGPCAWNRSQHRNRDGYIFEWVQPGDFISYPRHVGKMRNYKGVTFVVLCDDEITERLVDPMVFHEDEHFNLNIPQADLEKYNTVYNPNFEG